MNLTWWNAAFINIVDDTRSKGVTDLRISPAKSCQLISNGPSAGIGESCSG